MSPLPAQRLPYAAALDGLRAIAVVAVVGYHLEIGWMQGGFLGVDLFFVISGFLITRLLLDEHRSSGRIGLGGFWVRRFRRLVPPLVVVVGASVLATWLWGVPAQWQAMRGDAVAALGYAANWRFIVNDTSYFETLAGPSPLRHIWSLAVEEQWYVLWPLVMIALVPVARRRRGAGWVSVALLGVGALSAIWMAVLFDPSDVSRVYYGTDTRAQQLLVGAALAWVTIAAPERFTADRLRQARLPMTAAVVGFLVVVATVNDESGWLYRGGLFALSIGAAMLVLGASVPGRDGPLGWLAHPMFVGVGKRSYGLYLWHWPVIVFVGAPMGLDLAPVALGTLHVAVTVGLNEVMYRWIETPVRSTDIGPRRLLGGWTAGGAATMVTAVVLLATNVPTLPDIEVLRPDLEALAAEPPAPSTPAPRTAPRPAPLIPAPSTTSAPVEVAPIGAAAAATAKPPRILLVGDSTALVLAVNQPDGLPTRWRSVEYALVGCAITEGDTIDVDDDRITIRDHELCDAWASDWSEVAALFRPDLSIVMVGAWEVLDHVVDGERLSFPSTAWTAHVTRAIERAADEVSIAGSEVAFLRLPCMNQAAGSVISAQARNDPARVAAFNDILEQVAAASPIVTTLPLDDLLCPGGVALEEVGGEVIRSDGVHLTPAGSDMVWDWLDEQLVAFEPRVS